MSIQNEDNVNIFRTPAQLANTYITIGKALQRMCDENIGSLLVVDEGKLCGIFTERDLLKNWKNIIKPNFVNNPIKIVMTTSLVTCPVTEIWKVPGLMISHHIRHVPVVDENSHVVGVLSMRDSLEDQLSKLSWISEQKRKSGDADILYLGIQGGVEQILNAALGKNLRARVWLNVTDAIESVEFNREMELGKPVCLDLDRVDGKAWKGVIKKLSARRELEFLPELYLFCSQEHFSKPEIESLKKISAAARWHIFEKPIAIAPLIQCFRKTFSSQ